VEIQLCQDDVINTQECHAMLLITAHVKYINKLIVRITERRLKLPDIGIIIAVPRRKNALPNHDLTCPVLSSDNKGEGSP
jgi:hypothetical protein